MRADCRANECGAVHMFWYRVTVSLANGRAGGVRSGEATMSYDCAVQWYVFWCRVTVSVANGRTGGVRRGEAKKSYGFAVQRYT